MSRVANNPVSLPKGVEVTISGSSVSVKGGGTMEMTLTDGIGINVDGETVRSLMISIPIAPWREPQERYLIIL